MANTKIPSELIADSAITAAKLADGTITTADIADSNVTTAKIADSNVTTAKIGDAQVTTAKIVDANVTTAKIADSNVTTAKILDNNITSAKLASALTLGGTTTFSGNISLGDSVRVNIGSDNDLALFHTGSNGVIHNTTGALRIRTNTLNIQDYTNEDDMITATSNGSVDLYHNNQKKFETTSSGVSVTGSLSITADEANPVTFTESGNGLLTVATGDDFVVDAGGDIAFDADGGDIRFKDAGSVIGSISMANSDITLTASSDDLILTAADNIHLICQGNEAGIDITGNGGVTLYYDGGSRFYTTDPGATMMHASGPTLTMTRSNSSTTGSIGSIVFGNGNWDSSMASIRAIQDGTNDGGKLEFQTQGDATSGEQTRLTISRTGVSNFSGNVGIGTGTNVDELLHIEKSSGTTLVKTEVAANSVVGFEIAKTGSTAQTWRIVDGQTVNGKLQIYDVTDSRSVMTFDGSGNVGIGRNDPNYLLDVDGIISSDIQSGNTAGFLVRKAGSTKAYIGTSGGWEGNTDTDLAIAAETGGQIHLYSNGTATKRMTIDASGNVSIPDGDLTVSAPGTTANLIINGDTNSESVLRFYDEGSESWMIRQINSSNELTFRRSSQNHIYLDANGNTNFKNRVAVGSESGNSNTQFLVHGGSGMKIHFAGDYGSNIDLTWGGGESSDPGNGNTGGMLKMEQFSDGTGYYASAGQASGRFKIYTNKGDSLQEIVCYSEDGPIKQYRPLEWMEESTIYNATEGYQGAVGWDHGYGGIFKTDILQATTTGDSSSQFLSVYTSGHWGEYPLFKIRLYTTYYDAGYREYVCQVGPGTLCNMHNVPVRFSTANQSTASAGDNTTYEFGSNAGSITVGSAVLVGNGTHSGQSVYRRDFTMNTGGAYSRVFAVVETHYGSNPRVRSSSTSSSDADTYFASAGGGYHFKTMSNARMFGRSEGN